MPYTYVNLLNLVKSNMLMYTCDNLLYLVGFNILKYTHDNLLHLVGCNILPYTSDNVILTVSQRQTALVHKSVAYSRERHAEGSKPQYKNSLKSDFKINI